MRPENIWDVLSQTAGHASEAIPAYQREKRDLADRDRQFGLRAAADADKQASLDSYRQSMLGFQRARLDASNSKPDYVYHPNWSQFKAAVIANPEKYGQDVYARVMELEDGAEPKPQKMPDIVGNTQAGLRREVANWQQSRKPIVIGQDDSYHNVYGPDPNTSPTPPTLESSRFGTPSLLEMARDQADFYGLEPDSIENRLTGKPVGRFGLRPAADTAAPRLGARAMFPSHQSGDLESRGRQEFEDWDTLTADEKQAVAQKMGWVR